MIDPVQHARLEEACEIEHTLRASLDAEGQRLLLRLDVLECDMMAAAEDDLLRIAGAVLLEHGLDHLFELIYRRARSSSWYEPGDGRRFLFGKVEP